MAIVGHKLSRRVGEHLHCAASMHYQRVSKSARLAPVQKKVTAWGVSRLRCCYVSLLIKLSIIVSLIWKG
jgi:hypothetical protein